MRNMRNMKRKMAAFLAAALMIASMPVTAAEAALPMDTGQSVTAVESGKSGGGDAAADATGVTTLSGQLGKDPQAMAEKLAGELSARITEEAIAEIVHRAEDAWMESDVSEAPEDADLWEMLYPFLEKEVMNYLEDVLEKAKEEYEELEDAEVYQAVLDAMRNELMKAVEQLFEEYGASDMSLQPLEEKTLTVNLEGLTPVELTMIPFSTVFQGEDMTGVKEIAYSYYRYSDPDDYVIGKYPGNVDLSRGIDGYDAKWLMIPDSDQLNGRAKRYVVDVKNTNAKEWLVPTAYMQDGAGKRTEAAVYEYRYYDGYSDGSRELDIYMPSDAVSYDSQIYLKLDLNSTVYGASENRKSIRVYEGSYQTAEEAVKGKDITGQIYGNIDMKQKDAGYGMGIYSAKKVTFVSFDAGGNATGCLPLELYVGKRGHEQNNVSTNGMFKRTDYGREYVSYSSSYEEPTDELQTITYELYDGYAADDRYYFSMDYYSKGTPGADNSKVTAAYLGEYESIAAAKKSGAADIKGKLFGAEGYEANYSKGVYFSIFVGEDGTGQEAYYFCVKTKEGIVWKDSSTGVTFTGLVDKDGNRVDCYVVKPKDDSYAEGNYPVIMVEAGVDLTKLAPEFYTSTGVNLYAAGSSTQEKTGESYHDFSKGPVHYTTASEDGKNQKNVWLAVKQETSASTAYNLYTNSLEDKEANTRVEGGVVYSKREVILRNSDEGHDIFLINMGDNTIPKLSVELTSDVLKLDEYWTLNGNHDLSAFAGVADTTRYGELANMAKVRLKVKDGIISGEEVKGTLTIKAADTTIMVLELTGIAGVPVITTDSIPEAVKYVPYGTMIQNSNKYSKTKVRYALDSGALPDGMELRENGELYGVPKETGSFDFWVRMASQNPNSSASRMFTLVVKENTNENVDGSTDSGYDVTQRIPTVAIGSSGSYDFVSQGVLGEFTDVFLDGEKLVKDVDYQAESGSTRLTIRSQTLTKSNEVGTHTLGVEFRTSGESLLKKAAQNFEVVSEGTVVGGDDQENNNSGNSGSGNSGSANGNSGNSNSGNSANASSGALAWVSGMQGAAGMTGAETVIYTVLSGDTLSKIAMKYYGNASMWRKIYEDNRDVIVNPNRIRAGQRIKIYLARAVQEADASVTNGRTYTVRKGDNLWKIAAQVYGSGWKWRRIYDANRKQIPDTLILHAGQVIVIP